MYLSNALVHCHFLLFEIGALLDHATKLELCTPQTLSKLYIPQPAQASTNAAHLAGRPELEYTPRD